MLNTFGIICLIIALFIIGALFLLSFIECIEDGLLVGWIVCGGISLVCFGFMVVNCLKLYELKITKNNETSSSEEASHSESDNQEGIEECTIEINGQMYEIMPIQ